ncbi:MAG TPA: tetratricopeptide repeat protein [Thermoplasmata archaeon]|nr:tetratricopeptide repeat protein [Thermoplasmata archaeon]
MIAERRPSRETIEALIESLRANARDAELWARIGEVLLEAGRFERAVRAFDLALRLEPGLHRASIGLAIALDVCDGDLSEREAPATRTAVWETLQILEALVHGLREGRPSLFVDVHVIRIQKTTRRRLAANPRDPDALFLQSALLAKQGAFEDAISVLDHLASEVEYPGAKQFRAQLEQMAAASAAPEEPTEGEGVPRP